VHRLALPALVVFAAVFVAWQNLDGDGEFWLLPYLELLPFVGADLQARGLATAGLIGGLGLISTGLQGLSWRRAHRREAADQAELASVDALRDWHEAHAWDGVLDVGRVSVDGLSERAGDPAAPGGVRTPDLGG